MWAKHERWREIRANQRGVAMESSLLMEAVQLALNSEARLETESSAVHRALVCASVFLSRDVVGDVGKPGPGPGWMFPASSPEIPLIAQNLEPISPDGKRSPGLKQVICMR